MEHLAWFDNDGEWDDEAIRRCTNLNFMELRCQRNDDDFYVVLNELY